MFHHITRRALILAGTATIAAGAAAPAAIAQPPLPGRSEDQISCDYKQQSVNEQMELYKKAMVAGNYGAANRALGVAIYDLKLAQADGCSWSGPGGGPA